MPAWFRREDRVQRADRDQDFQDMSLQPDMSAITETRHLLSTDSRLPKFKYSLIFNF